MSHDEDHEAIEALKARVLAQAAANFDRDIAEAKRLASTYPDIVKIIAAGNKAAPERFNADQAPVAAPEAPDRKYPDFDGSVSSLIACYRSSPAYKKIQFRTRENYNNLFSRLERELGPQEIKNIDLQRLHDIWTAGGRLSMATGLLGAMRLLTNFGSKSLKDQACSSLRLRLQDMKFQRAFKPRKFERITAEQVIAVRAMAHKMGRPSIALAQAFQFECMLPQKDVIGEWVPVSESQMGTLSDVIDGEKKWLGGIRWSAIDANRMIFRHRKRRGKDIEINLRRAPMVMEELVKLGTPLPTTGPMIISERYGRPYINHEFRHKWREIAQAAGVPDNVFNMDSRRSTDDDEEPEKGRDSAR